jgi:hypothetical protein
MCHCVRDRTKAALVKNIKITNNQLTDEQIEEKIDNNDISVFSSAIIQVLIVGVSAYRTKSGVAFLLCSGCGMRIRMAHPDPGGQNDPQREKKRRNGFSFDGFKQSFFLLLLTVGTFTSDLKDIVTS